MRYFALTGMISGVLLCSAAHAVNETGSGQPQTNVNESGTGQPQINAGESGTGQPLIQLSLQDQVALIEVVQGEVWAVGRANLQGGYGQADLDAFSGDGTQPNWGAVELLQHCGGTDVVLYQTINGQLQEQWLGTLAGGQCP